MEESKCKKQYPCKFQSEIMMDVNKYLIYRRKDYEVHTFGSWH
jgi:hypothetical protein